MERLGSGRSGWDDRFPKLETRASETAKDTASQGPAASSAAAKDTASKKLAAAALSASFID